MFWKILECQSHPAQT